MATLIIFPEADGFLRSSGADAATANAGTGVFTTGAGVAVGQLGATAAGNDGTYQAWQAFFRFDIAAIPEGAKVHNAQLVLGSVTDNSTVDFVIEAWETDHPDTPTAADWLTPAELLAKWDDGERLAWTQTNAVATGMAAIGGAAKAGVQADTALLRKLELGQQPGRGTLRFALASANQRNSGAFVTGTRSWVSAASVQNATVGLRPFLRAFYALPAAAPMQYAESLGNTVSAAADTTKLSLAFTPDADSTYAFLWRANIVQDKVNEGGVDHVQTGQALASGSTLTVSKPTGTVKDDLVLVAVSARATVGTVTPPDGTWTQIGTMLQGTTAPKLWVFRKWAGPAEPTDYVFTLDVVEDEATATGGAYRGVDMTAPIVDTDSLLGAGDVASWTSPAVDSVENGTVVIFNAVANSTGAVAAVSTVSNSFTFERREIITRTFAGLQVQEEKATPTSFPTMPARTFTSADALIPMSVTQLVVSLRPSGLPPVVGLRNEGAVWDNDAVPLVRTTLDSFPVGGLAIRSFGASPAPITESIVVAGHPLVTTTISDATMVAIKLTADDYWLSDDTVRTSPASTADQVYGQLDLLEPGRYWCISYVELASTLPGAHGQVKGTTRLGTAGGLPELVLGTMLLRASSIWQPFLGQGFVPHNGLNPPGMAAGVQSVVGLYAGGPINQTKQRRARMVAIRADNLLRQQESTSVGQQTNNQAVFSGAGSVGSFWEPSDHLVVQSGVLYKTAGTTQPGEIEVSEQTPAAANTQIMRVSANPSGALSTPTVSAFNQVPYVMFRRRTLTLARTVFGQRIRVTGGANTAATAYSRASVLQLAGVAERPWQRVAGSINGTTATLTTAAPTAGFGARDGDLLVAVGLCHASNSLTPRAPAVAGTGSPTPWQVVPGFPQVSGNLKVYFWTKRASNEGVLPQYVVDHTLVVAGATAVFAFASFADAGGIDDLAFDFGDYTAGPVTPSEANDVLLYWNGQAGQSEAGGTPLDWLNFAGVGTNPGLGGSWFSPGPDEGVPSGTVASTTAPPAAGTKMAALMAISPPVVDNPDRAGTGLLGAAADVAATGRKGGAGTGGIDVDTLPASSGRKDARGAGAIGVTAALVAGPGQRDVAGTALVTAPVTLTAAGSKATAGEGGAIGVELELVLAAGKRITGQGPTFEVEVDLVAFGARVVRQAGGTMALTVDFTTEGHVIFGAITEIIVGFGRPIGSGTKRTWGQGPGFGVDFRFRGFGGIPPIVNIYAEMLVAALKRAQDVAARPPTQTSTLAGRSMDVRAGPMVTASTEDR